MTSHGVVPGHSLAMLMVFLLHIFLLFRVNHVAAQNVSNSTDIEERNDTNDTDGSIAFNTTTSTTSTTTVIHCVGDFSNWGPCMNGQKSRTFVVGQVPSPGGKDCLYEDGYVDERSCGTDCVGQWGNMTDCFEGMQYRLHSHLVRAAGGGRNCDTSEGAHEWHECGIPCIGEWTSWTDCIEGTQDRFYQHIQIVQDGGRNCDYGQRHQQQQSCGTPCVAAYWPVSGDPFNPGTMLGALPDAQLRQNTTRLMDPDRPGFYFFDVTPNTRTVLGMPETHECARGKLTWLYMVKVERADGGASCVTPAVGSNTTRTCSSDCIGAWDRQNITEAPCEQDLEWGDQGGSQRYQEWKRKRVYTVKVQAYNYGKGCSPSFSADTTQHFEYDEVRGQPPTLQTITEAETCIPPPTTTTTTTSTTTTTTSTTSTTTSTTTTTTTTTSTTTTTTRPPLFTPSERVVAVSPTFALSLPPNTQVAELRSNPAFTLSLCAGFVDSMNTMLSMVRATNSTTPTSARLSNQNCRVADVRANRRMLTVPDLRPLDVIPEQEEEDDLTVNNSILPDILNSLPSQRAILRRSSWMLNIGADSGTDRVPAGSGSVEATTRTATEDTTSPQHRVLQTVSFNVVVDFELVIPPPGSVSGAVPAGASGAFSGVVSAAAAAGAGGTDVMTTQALTDAIAQATPAALSHTIKSAVNSQLTLSNTPVMVDGVGTPPPPQELSIMELDWSRLATANLEMKSVLCERGDRVRITFGYDSPNFLDFSLWKVQTEADYVQCNTRNSTEYASARKSRQAALEAGVLIGRPPFPEELMPKPIIWPPTFAGLYEFTCDTVGTHFFIGEGAFCHKGRAEASPRRELLSRHSRDKLVERDEPVERAFMSANEYVDRVSHSSGDDVQSPAEMLSRRLTAPFESEFPVSSLLRGHEPHGGQKVRIQVIDKSLSRTYREIKNQILGTQPWSLAMLMERYLMNAGRAGGFPTDAEAERTVSELKMVKQYSPTSCSDWLAPEHNTKDMCTRFAETYTGHALSQRPSPDYNSSLIHYNRAIAGAEKTNGIGFCPGLAGRAEVIIQSSADTTADEINAAEPFALACNACGRDSLDMLGLHVVYARKNWRVPCGVCSPEPPACFNTTAAAKLLDRTVPPSISLMAIPMEDRLYSTTTTTTSTTVTVLVLDAAAGTAHSASGLIVLGALGAVLFLGVLLCSRFGSRQKFESYRRKVQPKEEQTQSGEGIKVPRMPAWETNSNDSFASAGDFAKKQRRRSKSSRDSDDDDRSERIKRSRSRRSNASGGSSKGSKSSKKKSRK